MKLLDLLKEGRDDMDKDQKVKRALAFYKKDRNMIVKISFEEGQQTTFKVVLPDVNETSLDWSHNGDVIINIKGLIKVYYPSNFEGDKFKHKVVNTVKSFFGNKRIHISTFSSMGIKALPMDNQINESTEDDKLIKKALEVYKFLRKGTIKFEYDIFESGVTIFNVIYELPPLEDIHVEIHQQLKKPIITFQGGVNYKIKEESFDEDYFQLDDLIDDLKKRFVKYNIILVDLEFGDFQTQELDYDGPDDDEF